MYISVSSACQRSVLTAKKVACSASIAVLPDPIMTASPSRAPSNEKAECLAAVSSARLRSGGRKRFDPFTIIVIAPVPPFLIASSRCRIPFVTLCALPLITARVENGPVESADPVIFFMLKGSPSTAFLPFSVRTMPALFLFIRESCSRLFRSVRALPSPIPITSEILALPILPASAISFRPMSLEAAAGKNPVTHVGKLYNLLSHQAAHKIYTVAGGDVAEVNVRILSQIGKPISEPLSANVDLVMNDGVRFNRWQRDAESILTDYLDNIDKYVTQRVIRNELSVF